ncbi:MAG: hypothetical protein PWP49_1597 [Thermococcaceae archaeon]|nr:hypothetical protein [Thermococcaceae archaeon]MDK2983424.1 hypothetical protein [Thermococcaceae archaeon]MDN5321177.1 hypothetical protein [Thermococcaceae archaeon]
MLSLEVIYGVRNMLARIVYYKKNSIPEEEIVAVSKVEKALEIARGKLGKDVVSFEVEII